MCRGPRDPLPLPLPLPLLFLSFHAIRFGSRAPAHCPLSQPTRHDTTRRDTTRHAIRTGNDRRYSALHTRLAAASRFSLLPPTRTSFERPAAGRPACLLCCSRLLLCCLCSRDAIFSLGAAHRSASGQQLINLKRPIREPTRATTRHEATRRPPPARTPTGRPECRDSEHPFCTHVHITSRHSSAQRHGTSRQSTSQERRECAHHNTRTLHPISLQVSKGRGARFPPPKRTRNYCTVLHRSTAEVIG